MPRESTLAPLAGSRLSRAKTASSTRNTATCSPSTSAQTPVFGRISSRSQTTRCCRHATSSTPCVQPRRRPDLAALAHEQTTLSSVASLFTKWRKRLQRLRIVDRLLPFALVGVDDARHVGFELGADAERVFAHHLLQVVEAAFEVVEPRRRALQAVGGADVEHEEAVDVADRASRCRGPVASRSAWRGFMPPLPQT